MNNEGLLVKQQHNGWIAEMRQTPFVRATNAFMASPWGVAMVAVLTVISHIGSMEMLLYTLAVVYGLYVCAFGDDFLTLTPLFVFCYIAPSRVNNPGRSDESIFSWPTGNILIGICACLLLGVILRIALDPKLGFKKLFFQKRRLFVGMLLLGVGYMLSGINSEHYAEISSKNVLFGLLQFVTVFLAYFLFVALIDWKTVRKDYIMWIGFWAGCVIALEVFNLYFMYSGDFVVEGIIEDRWDIYLGWGMNNNIGAFLAMMLPFPFYLATRYKHGYLFMLPAVGMMVALFMTVSRASILGGCAVFLISMVFMICFSKHRKINALVGGSLLAVAVLLFMMFRHDLFKFFNMIFENGLLNDSGRWDIYKSGLEVFKSNPVFGEGFYPADMDIFASAYWFEGYDLTGFLPPRWHNTVIQLLASCGIVGLLAYGVHRIQTVWLVLRRPNLEKVFVGLSIFALLGMSLLDCHFFNLGPTLVYSLFLAFIEGNHILSQKEKKKKPKKAA